MDSDEISNSSSSPENSKNQITENINNKIKESESTQIKSNNESNNKNKNNKMRDDLKSYIMDNRRRVYQRIEGMEPEEDLSLHNNKIKANKSNSGNIGNNIILFKKYVIGIKKNIFLFIITIVGISLTWFGWVFTCGNFYSTKLYIICGIAYFLTLFFMILCFFIEPGIIPRKCPEFSKISEKNTKNENENEILKNNIKENDKEKENNNKEEEEINEYNNKIKDIEDKNNKKEANNEEIIPRIFTERKCITCDIIRPPGASHCRICDNCVQGFDHHCYYISNCVGKRNHKMFYLFLFFGSICGIEVSIFNFITIYHVFIAKAHETIFILYKSNKYLFILSVFLMSISLIYSYCGVRDLLCLLFPFLIGLIIFIIMWNKYIYILKNIPYYYNPYILASFFSAISFTLFVFSTFIGQTISICSGYTIKQSRSIRNEIIELSYSDTHNEINQEYLRDKTCKERIYNFIKFLKKGIDKSLIVPERDLIIK